MEAAVIELDEDEAVIVQEEDVEEIELEIFDPTEGKETRLSFYGSYTYIGRASNGSDEDTSVWKVYRIEVLEGGTINKLKAIGIKWTERLTATYI